MSTDMEKSRRNRLLVEAMQSQLQQVPDDQHRLRRLLAAVLAIGTDLDLRSLLQDIVEAAAATVDARYGALAVLDEYGEFVDLVTTVADEDWPKAVGRLPRGLGLLGVLVRDPRPLRVENIAGSPCACGFPPGHPIMHSLLGVPIRVRGTVYGNLYLSDRCDAEPFTATDEGMVTALAGVAGVAIENARLHGRFVKAGEELQRKLLPRLPDIRPIQAEARYQPASIAPRVGGDWHHVIVLPEGTRCIMVGDVMGHNIEAAITMHRISNMLSVLAYDQPLPPSEIVRKLDQALEGLGGGTMATLIMARLEQRPETSWRLRWTSAGHPPPLLITAGKAGYLDPEEGHGIPLGVDCSMPRPDHEYIVAPGSTLLFYTDGLVEHPHHTIGEGMDALARRAGALVGHSLTMMCDELVDPAGRTFHDDVALLALRIPAPDTG
jgi:hypothetical protein